jgi:hypothetical protein
MSVGFGVPPASRTKAVAAVARASTVLVRVFAAASGHFMSMYDCANSTKDSEFCRFSSATGKPDSTSNASPSRAACMSSARRLFASALVEYHSECGLCSVTHRTP